MMPNWMTPAFMGIMAVFVAMQIVAQIALKLGSPADGRLGDRRWWLGFIGANAVGAPSLLWARELYRLLPSQPNVVAALTLAMTLVCTQLVFRALFRRALGIRGWLGITLIAMGAVLVTAGGR